MAQENTPDKQGASPTTAGVFLKDHLTTISTAALVYCGTVATCYLFAYWSTFKVNILEYVSFGDVIKLALFPMMLLAAVLLHSTIALEPVVGLIKPNVALGIKFRNYLAEVTVGCVIATVLLLNTVTAPARWGAACFLIGLPILFYSERIPVLGQFLTGRGSRKNYLMVLLVMPVFAFCFGKMQAEETLRGKVYVEVKTTIFKNPDTINDVKTLKFLGAAGDYFFFLTPDNKDLITAQYSDFTLLRTTIVTH